MTTPTEAWEFWTFSKPKAEAVAAWLRSLGTDHETDPPVVAHRFV